MAFDLTDDQRDLVDGVRMLCAGRFQLDDVRAIEQSGRLNRTMWSELVQAGVFGLRVAEDVGGVVESTLVFEQLGRHLVTCDGETTTGLYQPVDPTAYEQCVAGRPGWSFL